MDRIDKTLGILFLLALTIIITIVSCFGFVYFKYQRQINLFLSGEMLEKKEYCSHKHKVSLLLHTIGSFHYESYIYIVEGKYDKKNVPTKGKYIKFPDGAGVILEWTNEHVLQIVSDSEPIHNTLKPSSFAVYIDIDRDKFDQLIKGGKHFTSYEIDSQLRPASNE